MWYREGGTEQRLHRKSGLLSFNYSYSTNAKSCNFSDSRSWKSLKRWFLYPSGGVIHPYSSVHTNQQIKIPAVLDVDLGPNTFLQWSSSNCTINKPLNFSHLSHLPKQNKTTEYFWPSIRKAWNCNGRPGLKKKIWWRRADGRWVRNEWMKPWWFMKQSLCQTAVQSQAPGA